jgi:hypothetical protein
MMIPASTTRLITWPSLLNETVGAGRHQLPRTLHHQSFHSPASALGPLHFRSFDMTDIALAPIQAPTSDFADWAKIEALRAELAAQILPRNKEALFEALARVGIATVTVTFDGCGDSGQIEEITARAADDCEMELPDEKIEITLIRWHADESPPVATSLRDAIEQLCYEFLSLEHGGWENNDGAYGEFSFVVSDRTIALEHNERFASSELYTHEW